jgi:hypothetical protein
MMDHQQVRAWILDREAYDAETSKLAAEHLAGCAECQVFAGQWEGARGALHMRHRVEPAPGFRRRWFARLEQTRRRRHRRQVALALILSVFGSASIFVAMAWWVFNRPASIAGVVLSHVSTLDVQIHVIMDSLRIVLDTLPPIANFGLLWAAVAAGLGLIMLYTGFSALWTASFYRAVLQTRTKEI